jgi:hypothetical protein
MAQPDPSHHLSPHTVAQLADGLLDASERALAAEHLASCRECRDELAEVRGILRTERRHRRPWLIPAAGAAAAAVILLLVWPAMRAPSGDQDLTREPALTTTLAPRPIAPLDSVADLDSVRWSSVPGTIRYRLTVFAADGDVVWQTSPTDTTVGIPDTLDLTSGDQYYWQIKAETGHGRWVESELVPFTLMPRGRLP